MKAAVALRTTMAMPLKMVVMEGPPLRRDARCCCRQGCNQCLSASLEQAADEVGAPSAAARRWWRARTPVMKVALRKVEAAAAMPRRAARSG